MPSDCAPKLACWESGIPPSLKRSWCEQTMVNRGMPEVRVALTALGPEFRWRAATSHYSKRARNCELKTSSWAPSDNQVVHHAERGT